MFRGGLPTLLRESIGNAVFCSTYELSRHYLRKRFSVEPSSSSHHSKLLVDTGIGVVTGGLSGTAVSKKKFSSRYHSEVSNFLSTFHSSG